MAVNCNNTAGQYLSKSIAASATETVGFWLFMRSIPGYRAAWTRLGGGDYRYIFMQSPGGNNEIGMEELVVGSTAFSVNSPVPPINSWLYIVARFISATNRWIAFLDSSSGAIGQAQNTTNTGGAPATTSETIGSDGGTSMDALLGQHFTADIDIQADGGQLNEATMRQLAYGGPFSIPHLAPHIIEFNSFRKHPTQSEIGETYWGDAGGGIGGIRYWDNNGGITTGQHPPLPYWHKSPVDFIRNTVI